MSYTIYHSTPTALIPQPGRAVNTFPSGLVRVDQTYLGLTSQAATHRATLAVGNDMPDGDSTPCIDGLKIFPEVQERRREDGFTEYIVSAYGRVNSAGQKTFERILFTAVAQLKINILNPNGTSELVEQNVLTKCTIERLIWSFAAPKNAEVSILTTETLKVFRLNGEQWQSSPLSEFITSSLPGYFYEQGNFFQNPENVVRQLITTINPISIDKTNYGGFDEWKVVYESEFPVLNFRETSDKFYQRIEAPQYDTTKDSVKSLRGKNVGAKNLTLGPVWNLGTSSASIGNSESNFIELGNTDVITYNGQARISGDEIIHSFGYVNSGFVNSGFVPFQRPSPGSYRLPNPPPPNVIQGRAEWEPSIAIKSDSEGQYGSYVYNLKNPLNEWFKWTVSNEINQESEFFGKFTYSPEILDPE